MPLPPRPPARPFGQEILTRQRLVRVALGREEADLILRGATVLNVHSLAWKEGWDIVISGERIAWTGPAGVWPGQAKEIVSVEGLWAVPGFGEAHKHIESTMLSPEYEADLVLRFGTTWNVEASHEFSNVNGAQNVQPVQDFSLSRLGHTADRVGGERRLLRLRGNRRVHAGGYLGHRRR
jgi:adenine deaminase